MFQSSRIHFFRIPVSKFSFFKFSWVFTFSSSVLFTSSYMFLLSSIYLDLIRFSFFGESQIIRHEILTESHSPLYPMLTFGMFSSSLSALCCFPIFSVSFFCICEKLIRFYELRIRCKYVETLRSWAVFKLSLMYNNRTIILLQERTFLDVIRRIFKY